MCSFQTFGGSQRREPASSLSLSPCSLALVGTWYSWDWANQLKVASHGSASLTLRDRGDSPGPLPQVKPE